MSVTSDFHQFVFQRLVSITIILKEAEEIIDLSDFSVTQLFPLVSPCPSVSGSKGQVWPKKVDSRSEVVHLFSLNKNTIFKRTISEGSRN